jgi:hypothetical protein
VKGRIREACILLGVETIQNALSLLVNKLHHSMNVNGYHLEDLRHYNNEWR